ncbi:hypothetical protein GGR53DRAFT_497179 [Hypoxylon sp. FL1150]|nr:hypothetical protein GGR53DRAFT_497179 [Hypoxylon sp. FL1150]
MASNDDFKVIIVGGGVAGLTLANMLGRFNIDYVLLEGHDKIIPNTGASIGLAPHGLLVLDQLGIYDAIREMARGGELDDLHMLDVNDGGPLKYNIFSKLIVVLAQYAL